MLTLNPFRTTALALAASTSLAVAAVVPAQQPRIANGRITNQSAGSPFAQSFRALVASQADVTWIGYAVPVVDGERMMCCFDGDSTFINGDVISSNGRTCCRTCRLEPSADGTSMARRAPAANASGVVRLEGSDRMIVLVRVAAKEVDRIRVFSEDCELDAGGRPIIWLDGVRAADSVALLETYASPADGRRDRVSGGAVTAIALTGDASADAALDRLVAAPQPEALRKKVTFWLGNARGAHGLQTLRRVLKEDQSAEVQKSAVFGVSQSHEPGAADLLTNVAQNDANPRLRSEALFWIGQKGSPQAASIIQQAIDKDPSTEVRKKAVFALSQLKDDAGLDALIRVAKTSNDPPTRGEAVFWLGQKAGKKVSAVITDTINQDPDTEVKKKAVFALSQMPKDEGVPLLIQVARTNPNPAVRKQAMFWLGQSKDQRAVDFFAEILK
jgi:HEAT repeat protein